MSVLSGHIVAMNGLPSWMSVYSYVNTVHPQSLVRVTSLKIQQHLKLHRHVQLHVVRHINITTSTRILPQWRGFKPCNDCKIGLLSQIQHVFSSLFQDTFPAPLARGHETQQRTCRQRQSDESSDASETTSTDCFS